MTSTALNRFLIVSLGSIGQRHLRNLRQLRPDAHIAVLRRPGSNDSAAGADHICHSLAEALAFGPHAAVIASPSSLHLETALPLAQAGVHLLIEKPTSNGLAGVDELVQTCRQNRLALRVGYNLRFLPSLRQARQQVLDGAIGRVVSVRAEVGQYLPMWRPQADYRQGVTAQAALGGGALLELSHDIDYVLWMLGLPQAVCAVGGRFGDLELDVEDTVELLLRYARPSRVASIHLDLLQRAVTRRCKLVGTEGTLVWDAIADTVELFTAASGQWELQSQWKLADKNEMYLDELQSFLEGAQSGEPTQDDGGVAVLRIIELARQSMAAGGTHALQQENRN